MTAYTIEVDEAQIAEAKAFFTFVGGNSEKALQVAINRAGPIIKVDASKRIREDINLKASYVKGRLEFIGARKGSLTGRISANRRGILLSRFSTSPQVRDPGRKWNKPPPLPARGIRVKVKPKNGTKAMTRSAFYMVLKDSLALGIVTRDRSKTNGQYDVKHGPSVSQVFDDTRAKILPKAGQTLTDELARAMGFLLRKQFPKE